MRIEARPAAVLKALSAGRMACTLIEAPSQGRIAAVHASSLHVEIAGHVMTIGSPKIGNGPLNVLLDLPAWLDLATACEPGLKVRVTCGSIEMERHRIDVRPATGWRPPPWPAPASLAAISKTLDQALQAVGSSIPADGLARLALGIEAPAGPVAPIGRSLAQKAAPAIAALRTWLAAEPLAGPPLDLLGLGPGLTPSGDDLLGGLMMGLAARGSPLHLAALATAVRRTAPRRTTALSVSLLTAAAEGEGHEHVHAFIGAALRASPHEATCTLVELSRLGHTSGWDAAAGAILALRANLPDARK